MMDDGAFNEVAKIEYSQCFSVKADHFRDLELCRFLDLGKGSQMLNTNKGGVQVDVGIGGIGTH